MAWQEAVFTLYLAEDKIESEVVESMRGWHGHRRAAMVDGLWQSSAARAPPDGNRFVGDPRGSRSGSHAGSSDEPRELTQVDMDTFPATLPQSAAMRIRPCCPESWLRGLLGQGT